MAESTMITSYPNWIETRWEGMFDAVEGEVGSVSGSAVAWSGPSSATYHGGTPASGLLSTTLLASLINHNMASNFDTYWNAPTASGVWDIGIGTYEDEAYQLWKTLDTSPGTNTYIGSTVSGFVTAELSRIDNQIFPALLTNFTPFNMVFSSIYARMLYDAYEKVDFDARKLDADLRMQASDRGATRTVEVLKLAMQRKTSADATRVEISLKKTAMLAQLQELQTKVGTTANQVILQDAMNTYKADYLGDITEARWSLDNFKYQFEAMASLHGASMQSSSSSADNSKAMSGFEKNMSIASAAVGLAGGAASAVKDIMDIWK